MKANLCSISFRHELISFRELLGFAVDLGFSAVELWSVHANSLVRHRPIHPFRFVREMRETGIGVSMISGYADLLAESAAATDAAWDRLVLLARLFRTDKIRIFAGDVASADASPPLWERCASRLRRCAEIASAYGICTVIETHPGTLADRVASVRKLLRMVRHPSVKINFDVLHVWESGDNVADAYFALKPWIVNFHFKNVRSRSDLGVFDPANVYSPSGCRDSMVPLAEGAVDYEAVVRTLVRDRTPHDVSLEWFGNDPFRYLSRELRWLEQSVSGATGNRDGRKGESANG